MNIADDSIMRIELQNYYAMENILSHFLKRMVGGAPGIHLKKWTCKFTSVSVWCSTRAQCGVLCAAVGYKFFLIRDLFRLCLCVVFGFSFSVKVYIE